MFAGKPGVGAEDAWFMAALDLEEAAVTKQAYIGGTLDLFKCFDQVVRPLLYLILGISGVPVPVLTAYVNYHEQ
eukprot:11218282-Karenia_brevis.AAC.1